MILEAFPSAEEFYKQYWGKKPFIVRGFIPPEVIDSFVDGDTLAGLALEEDIKSRIITNNAAGDDWTCEHGPFDDDRFDGIGDENWSLLVQNVEQYHTETAELLKYFQRSPRWLLDDIMVSFSAPGGSVGPHTDSYHTFLVQGIGKRTWKISNAKVEDSRYADNPDVKVLANGFDGETFEVTAGDVIYMPPFFGHEGKTIEAAMTFSVGFLGPKLSEMLGDYARYLEENEVLNTRYLGEVLKSDSSGFTIDQQTQIAIRNQAVAAIESDDFAVWMASYFSEPSHDDAENIEVPEEGRSGDALQDALKSGATLHRPEHIKMVIAKLSDGTFTLGVYGDVICVSSAQERLVEQLNGGHDIAQEDLDGSGDRDEAITFIAALYNKGVLRLVLV